MNVNFEILQLRNSSSKLIAWGWWCGGGGGVRVVVVVHGAARLGATRTVPAEGL